MSMLIPRAIDAMMLVLRLSTAPVAPMRPKKTRRGKRLGIIAMIPNRIERNIADMRTKMTPVDSARLSICPVTMFPLVRV